MKILNLVNVKFWLFIGCLIPLATYAQQDPQYTHYMYNTMSVNPGYTGSIGSLEANVLYRSQWVGVDGAPETQNFGIHSPLSNERIGVGLDITNDKIGPSSEQFINGNFSYTIPVTYTTKLALGVKAGARILNIDWTKGTFKNQSDVLLNNNIDNKLMPSLGAGAYYYSNRWYVGLSVPNFIRSDYYDDIEEAVLSDELHYYLMAGYVMDLSRSIKFKPAFLGKVVAGAPFIFDVSANFLFNEVFTAGVSYRWDDSVSAIAGFNFMQNFFVGYSYDYTTTDFQKYNDGTHEIILRYQATSKSSRIKSPRFF
ncbi:MAG: PorP/SprF family type IX secretion system membrane protein [Mesonia hippocampi]|uniref:PorP/SprF family type IX secretion system membrane protein n=1 Tax=Mesonia hippocampi TaxID=1628250 RepID=UPI003F9C67D0